MNENKYFTFFYLILLVGLVGHYNESLFGIMLFITPVILLIMGLLMIFVSGFYSSRKFVLWFVILYLFTLILEIIGVHSGKIFGEYVYGNVLGFKPYGVPLIIGFNWMLVILGSINIACKLSNNVFAICFTSSLLAVIFDFVLEPGAMNFGYWEWKLSRIPFQNYFAWFSISFLVSLSVFKFKVNVYSKAFIHYFAGLIIFFFYSKF